MTAAEERWSKYYHNQGKQLYTEYDQFSKRVSAWENINRRDSRLPQAKYDQYQAARAYNHFVSDEGRLISAEQNALENQLKNTPPGTFQHQSLTRQIDELQGKFNAWSDVVAREQHQSVHMPSFDYQGRNYSLYSAPTWSNRSAEGLFQNAVETVDKGTRDAWNNTSPVTKQGLCKLMTGEFITEAAGGMMRTPGNGHPLARALADHPRDMAIGEAIQPPVDSTCERMFPTNDSILRQLDQSSLPEPSYRTRDPFFHALYTAAAFGNDDQMKQAMRALTESEYGQEALVRIRSEWQEQDRLEQETLDQELAQLALVQQQETQVQEHARVLVRVMEMGGGDGGGDGGGGGA